MGEAASTHQRPTEPVFGAPRQQIRTLVKIKKKCNCENVCLPPLTFGSDICKPQERVAGGCECTLNNDPFGPLGGPRGKG